MIEDKPPTRPSIAVRSTLLAVLAGITVVAGGMAPTVAAQTDASSGVHATLNPADQPASHQRCNGPADADCYHLHENDPIYEREVLWFCYVYSNGAFSNDAHVITPIVWTPCQHT